MVTKLFEVIDKETLIPVIAIKPIAMNEVENFLIARAGFSHDIRIQENYVILVHIRDNKATYNPYDWKGRTMVEAHKYIIKNFDILENCEVLDIEYIVGETKEKKSSERGIRW